MAEPFTIYKVTILYMLSRAQYPLTNTLISNFFLLQDYTDFFHVQEALLSLEDAELIDAKISGSHTQYQYSITDGGRETLDFTIDKMTEGIKDDVCRYLCENQIRLREENAVRADYYKAAGSGYAAHCQLFSDKKKLIDLTLAAHTKEQAKAICSNWRSQNEEVYTYLMDILLK